MQSLKLKTVLKEMSGVFLFAAGIHCFAAGNNIVPGGITGVSTMISYLFGVSIGLASFLLNIPLLILGAVYLGRKTIIRTLITVCELSFMLDIGVAWLPVYKESLIGAVVLGGLFMGIGLSFILSSHTTTGGGDLLGKLMQKKCPGLSMGKILLGIDFSIIFLSIIVFGDIKNGICGILAMGISSILIDFLYQSDKIILRNLFIWKIKERRA